METKLSKELEKKWSSLFNRFDQMMVRHIGRDRARDSGLDSHGRLKTSIFYGENTDRWVLEAEKIFSRNQLSEVEKIEAATACFGGEAWDWFQWLDCCRPVQTWEELKERMIIKFRPSMGESTPEHTFAYETLPKSDKAAAHMEDMNKNGKPWRAEHSVQKDLTAAATGPTITNEDPPKFEVNKVGEEGLLPEEKKSAVAEQREKENKKAKEASAEITITSRISPNFEETGVTSRITHRREKPGRKENEATVNPSEPTVNLEIPPKIEEIELSKAEQNRKEELDKDGNFVNGLKSMIWAEGKMLKLHGFGPYFGVGQKVKKRNEFVNLAQANYKINTYASNQTNTYTSNQTQTSGIPFVGPTGYGIFRDNILLMGGRLVTQANSCNELTPNMVQQYGILNFEVEPNCHLEDKVDFEAAGNDKIPIRFTWCCHVICHSRRFNG